MDLSKRPKQIPASPRNYIQDADTTDEERREAKGQTAFQNSQHILKLESNGNASISISNGSADAGEAISDTRHGCDNVFSSANTQGPHFPLSLEVSRGFNMLGRSRNHSVPYGISMVNYVPIHYSNRNVSNYKMMTEINQAHKRTRSEICGKSSKHLSTDSEQKCMNSYEALEINTTCRASSDRSLFAGNNHRIQTNKQTFSNNPKLPILIKRSWSLGQNIASNKNIADKSRSIAPSVVSDSIPFKREGIRFSDDILAFPGPSGADRNINSKHISGDTFQPCFQSEMQAMKRNEEKALICNVCRSDISKHIYKDGRKFRYSCCICIHSSCEKADLQMHSDTHLPKKSCNVCQKEHAEGNLHDGEHTCAACEQTFHCKTELNEHILTNDYLHINYFYEHCWACSKNLDDHVKEEEGVKVYKCCICPSKVKYRMYLRKHAENHRPKIFCRTCKEEYHKGQEDLHNREFMCVLCKQTFLCQPMLEDHTKDNENYFYFYCRVWNKKIEDGHRNETEEIFHCCRCVETFIYKYELQNHLYTHTDLNLFKCVTCGGRFKQGNGLRAHLRFCPAVPYKCESCPAKFPRTDFLDLHCSVNHKESCL